MRLNVQTDYALRLLMHLAVNQDERVTIADVAQRFGISRNHLTKVAHLLGQHGYIQTVRGRSGGLQLARSPKKIAVGAVVRRMEPDFALVECFQRRDGQCLISPSCRLKGALREAVQAFMAVLDRFTLEDLVAKNPRLHGLLSIEAA